MRDNVIMSDRSANHDEAVEAPAHAHGELEADWRWWCCCGELNPSDRSGCKRCGLSWRGYQPRPIGPTD